jgi:hypothetical protein
MKTKKRFMVCNLSGNLGKSTFARNILLPNLNTEIISVESTNADGTEDMIMKGKRYTELLQAIGLMDDVIVDVGSSNVEDLLTNMRMQPGSHEEFDAFVVPVVSKAKQLADTIRTINLLEEIGIEAKRIKVVLNHVEHDDVYEDTFAPIYAHQAKNKSFSIVDQPIYVNELFPRLIQHGKTIMEVLSDDTDYTAKRRETADPEEKLRLIEMQGLKRLAVGIKPQLDNIFSEVAR